MATDPTTWADLFTRDVDNREAQFVKPADTDRSEWCVYDGGRYLGMVRADTDHDVLQWRTGPGSEGHHDLADALRAPLQCSVCTNTNT